MQQNILYVSMRKTIKLMSKIKERWSQWRDFWYSWAGRLNIAKMSGLPDCPKDPVQYQAEPQQVILWILTNFCESFYGETRTQKSPGRAEEAKRKQTSPSFEAHCAAGTAGQRHPGTGGKPDSGAKEPLTASQEYSRLLCQGSKAVSHSRDSLSNSTLENLHAREQA